jgi:hypothetical protein
MTSAPSLLNSYLPIYGHPSFYTLAFRFKEDMISGGMNDCDDTAERVHNANAPHNRLAMERSGIASPS